MKIKYREGYKYQLADIYQHQTELRPEKDIDTEFIGLKKDGLLIIKKGYAWDGASGPTFDTKSSMRGALIHDALYQLMREGYIETKHKKYADKLLRDICIEDGMWAIRAMVWYNAVRDFAGWAADPKNIKKICEAP